MGSSSEQPCWWCVNAYGTGNCPWANNLKPVEGWNANKIIIRNTNCDKKYSLVSSFKISNCPHFKDERIEALKKYPHLSDRQLAKKLGTSINKVKELRRKYDKV